MKTLFALILAGTIQFSTAATTAFIAPDTETKTVASGTAIGDICLSDDMTWGKFSTSSPLGSHADLYGGDFFAGNYTLSMWVDLSALSAAAPPCSGTMEIDLVTVMEQMHWSIIPIAKRSAWEMVH